MPNKRQPPFEKFVDTVAQRVWATTPIRPEFLRTPAPATGKKPISRSSAATRDTAANKGRG